jgi:UDP-galactopyranose mutase
VGAAGEGARGVTFAVAGAGWAGATIARRLAEAGHPVEVFERRNHVGGNCHTVRRRDVLVHAYGPHIFHTDDEDVWWWVQRWGEFRPYRLQVRSTTVDGQVLPLPVNLHTINQLYRRAWTPEQARRALPSGATDPVTFEDAAIATVGEPLYRSLFHGYTLKQWGIDPADLPASVFHRLPVRFDYDDNYFTHRYQAMPVDGYTQLFRRILDHPLITVRLGTALAANTRGFDHVFWTGPLDAWFSYVAGRLGYRTLDFRWEIDRGDRQGVAIMNWPDPLVEHTRVTEHNHLTPWESHPVSVRSFETPRAAKPGDELFYPLRLARDRERLDRYVEFASNAPGVTFTGRLGTYRYLDMDVTIREAHQVADLFLAGDRRPFYVDI